MSKTSPPYAGRGAVRADRVVTPPAAAPRACVELRGVSKRYQEGGDYRTVLDDLSVTFNVGETTALLGRSGSGKSTLLNLISGIDLPTSGDVLINDTPVTRLSEQQRTLFRRRHIGIVFQFFNLIPTLTVEENLLLPLELNGGAGAAERTAAAALLAQIGLGDRGASYPDALSGGEQQRVAIARAVIHRPALLLADEPTGNLDEETGRLVAELLRSVARQSGMTVILVTHSQEVARGADRIVTLSGGRLAPAAGA